MGFIKKALTAIIGGTALSTILLLIAYGKLMFNLDTTLGLAIVIGFAIKNTKI